MSIETEFADALSELDVGVTRTSAETCEAAIADAIEGETIGVPLQNGVSLPAAVNGTPTNGDLERADTGVTPAAFGIARTGSLYLENDRDGTELVSLYPRRHVAVLRSDDLCETVAAAMDRIGPALRSGGSGIIATGPSATADMGDLVVGAHGPGEVHVILIESETGGSRREAR